MQNYSTSFLLEFHEFFSQSPVSFVLVLIHTEIHPDITPNSRKSFLRFANSSTIGYPFDKKECPEGQPALFEDRVPTLKGRVVRVRRLNEFRVNCG